MRADSLQIQSAGSDIQMLERSAALDGLEIVRVAAANGTGKARLLSWSGSVPRLAWWPPGEAAHGPQVEMPSDGEYLLEGSDPDKWITVDAHLNYLPSGHASRAIWLEDIFNNEIATDDITAAEASAGDVETYTVTLYNSSSQEISDVCVWLDSAADGSSYLEISDDGSTWVSPTTEAAALNFGSIAPTASKTLHFRRTIPGATDPDTSVLNLVHLAFTAH